MKHRLRRQWHWPSAWACYLALMIIVIGFVVYRRIEAPLTARAFDSSTNRQISTTFVNAEDETITSGQGRVGLSLTLPDNTQEHVTLPYSTYHHPELKLAAGTQLNIRNWHKSITDVEVNNQWYETTSNPNFISRGVQSDFLGELFFFPFGVTIVLIVLSGVFSRR